MPRFWSSRELKHAHYNSRASALRSIDWAVTSVLKSEYFWWHISVRSFVFTSFLKNHLILTTKHFARFLAVKWNFYCIVSKLTVKESFYCMFAHQWQITYVGTKLGTGSETLGSAQNLSFLRSHVSITHCTPHSLDLKQSLQCLYFQIWVVDSGNHTF